MRTRSMDAADKANDSDNNKRKRSNDNNNEKELKSIDNINNIESKIEDNNEPTIIKSEGEKSLLSNFNISKDTIKLLNEHGITHLFPIQSLTYNPIYEGNDIIGRAMTGQGKTLAFILPIVQKIKDDPSILNKSDPCVIVISPY